MYQNLFTLIPFVSIFPETMRKHPSVPFLNRICVEDYKIPDSDFCVKKGTGVMISVTGLHRDPDIFPNPEKFDPQRFTKENVAARTPYVYFPFGEGPRVCIGKFFSSQLRKRFTFYNFGI